MDGGAVAKDPFYFSEIPFPCLDKLFCYGVELVRSVTIETEDIVLDQLDSSTHEKEHDERRDGC